MKKNLLSALWLVIIPMNLLAQSMNVHKFGIGVDIGGATGPMSERYATTFGGLLSYQLPIAKRFAVIANAGYHAFLGQYNTDIYTGKLTPNYSYTAIPVKAGLKYYLGNTVSVEGQAGTSFGLNSEGRTAFVYASGIGFDLAAGFGVGIRYENWVFKRRNPAWNEDLGQVAVRISFSF